MNFQSLPFVEDPQAYLDTAFARARKRADSMKGGTRIDKVLFNRKTSLRRISVARDNLLQALEAIVKEYPSFDGLPDFYEHLAKSQIDVDRTKQSLGRLQGSIGQIRALASQAERQVRAAESVDAVKKATDIFYARTASMLTRMSGAFSTIEKARKVLVTFPTVKTGCFTVALAGFPNVGKSTLLSKLTPSRPEIADYAFTTKTLNIGYYRDGHEKIQVIDTPGTLNRFETMNKVEQQAFLSLRYVADVIVFIIDPTETYSFETQEKLLKQVEDHEKPLLIYLSKTDIADPAVVARLQKKHTAFTDLDELTAAIAKAKKDG